MAEEITREQEVRLSGAEPVRAAAYEQEQLEAERARKKPLKVEDGDEDALAAREEELARLEGVSLKQPSSQPVGEQAKEQTVEEYAKEVEKELFGPKEEDEEEEEEEAAEEPKKEEKSGLFGSRKSNKRK